MEILCATVSSLDDDGLVPTFGFGDSTSRHDGTLDMGVCQVSQLWDTAWQHGHGLDAVSTP